MAVLFSAREIVEAAVEKEKKRRGFYSAVADLSQQKEMKDLFRFLTEEETRHVEAFTRIRDGLPEQTHSSTYTEEMQAYMDAVVDDQLYSDIDTESFVQKALDTNTVFRLAIGFEKDAILYFQAFLPYISESDQEIVKSLIEQEKVHIRKLAEMRTQLAAS